MPSLVIFNLEHLIPVSAFLFRIGMGDVHIGIIERFGDKVAVVGILPAKMYRKQQCAKCKKKYKLFEVLKKVRFLQCHPRHTVTP